MPRAPSRTSRNSTSRSQTWTISTPTNRVRPFFPSSARRLTADVRTAVVFLERLQSYPALPSSHALLLGKLYKFAQTQNAELRWRYYEVALLDPASTAAKQLAPEAATWIVGQDGTGTVVGRMKFCRPTFRAVARVDKDLAIRVFSSAKDAFHPIARRLIEKVCAQWPFFRQPLTGSF